MSPEVYLDYLNANQWAPKRPLGSQLIMSFMPMGIDPEVWNSSKNEKFFLGCIRKLPQDVEFLSSFGIGGPSARMHLALAIEAGVKEVVFVGTVGAMNPDLKLGDLVVLEGSARDFQGAKTVSYSTVFDLWESPKATADVVEMEAAHLFAWCQEKAVKCSGLAVVSDLFVENGWEPGFSQISDSLGHAHRLAYEALRKV